jgi:hypothetical protein
VNRAGENLENPWNTFSSRSKRCLSCRCHYRSVDCSGLLRQKIAQAKMTRAEWECSRLAGRINAAIMLPRCNKTFIPAPAPCFYIYAGRSVALALVTGAGVGFSYTIDFRTRVAAARQCLRLFAWLFLLRLATYVSEPSLAIRDSVSRQWHTQSQRTQIIGHVTELPQHGRIVEITCGRITGAAKRDCACMSQYFPKTLRTFYRDCRASMGFTNNDTAVSNIERQRHEICDFGHGTHPA